MYKVKLFSAEKMPQLQEAVNSWLHRNKEIAIHNSNLEGTSADNLGTSQYNFFILYSGPDDQAEELKEMAATAVQDHSIEVKEINPEIMKPSS